MDPAQMALMIPILALLIPIIAIWTQHQRKIEEIRTKAVGEVGAQAAARAAALEERVRVLEAIVTDKSYDVASQIEALRDSARRDGSAIEHGRN
jgi:hypothetical protein